MATVTYNNFSTNIREDVSDVIADLFPMETYVYTNASKVKATNTLHEWLADQLAAATTGGAVEGADFAETTVTPAYRWKNYTVISRKQFMISGTLEATNKVGRRSELARQATKQMRELKRNIEKIILNRQMGSAGATAAARASSGISAFISSEAGTEGVAGNAIEAATAAAAGFSTKGDASGLASSSTYGTSTVALTEAILNDALEAAWTDGGDTSLIVMGPSSKEAFSAFSGVATKYNQIMGRQPGVTIGSADVYVSDYGTVTAVLSRYIDTADVLCLDMSQIKVASLRAPQMIQIAATGDAEKRMLLWEGCVEVGNPHAHAKVMGTT